MNDKQLKKMLKANACDILPDEGSKARIKAVAFGEVQSPASQDVGGGTRAMIARRSVVAAGAAAIAAVVVTLAFLLPGSGGGPGASLGVNPNKLNTTSAQSFYAYGAASVGALISSHDSTGAIASASAYKGAYAPVAKPMAATLTTQTNQACDSEQIEIINSYLGLVEGLLSEGSIESVEIEGGEYECGMAVSYSDLLGNSVGYNMYYNRTFLGEEHEDDESQSFYSISGILVVDGGRYPVEGKYVIGREAEGEESELYFKAYTSEDKTSYIEVNRESENESEGGSAEVEYEYVYGIYQNGVLSESMRVEYETEQGETELVMVINKGGVTESLVFEEEFEDGERVIFVEGNINGTPVAFTIYVRDGRYHYVFGDGSGTDYDRRH